MKKQPIDYSKEIVEGKGGTRHIAVRNEDVESLRAFLAARYIHTAEEAATEVTDITVSAEVPKDILQTALWRYFELSQPGV